MPRGFSVGQALAVGSGAKGMAGARGAAPSYGGSFIKGVGESVTAQAPGFQALLGKKREESQLTELQKLERAVPASEQLLINDFRKNMDKMTDTQRQEAVVDLQKKLGTDGDKLLLYWVNRAAEAPPPSIETLDPRFKGAKDQIIRGLAGTQPTAPGKLEMGQLPGPRREEEWTKRMDPLEGPYPGITKETQFMVPTGVTGRELPEMKAARQRLVEAKKLGTVTKFLEEVEDLPFGFEKKEKIDYAYREKALFDDSQYEFALSQINMKKAPAPLDQYPETIWDDIGLGRDEQGNIVNMMSKNPIIGQEQENLRYVLLHPNMRLDQINSMPLVTRQKINIAAHGGTLIDKDTLNELKAKKELWGQQMNNWLDRPMNIRYPKLKAGQDQLTIEQLNKLFGDIYSLIIFFNFDLDAVAATMTVARDPAMGRAIVMEAGAAGGGGGGLF